MYKPAKMIAAAAGTIALVGGIGAGLAYADSPADSPTTGPTAEPTGKDPKDGGRAKHRRLIARAIHGEVTLAGKKHRVIAFQRGTVEAISDASLTVESPDGYRATYVIKAETTVRQGKKPGQLTDLTADDRVRVVAVKDGSTLTANRIRERVK
jgi:hypothetical protein